MTPINANTRIWAQGFQPTSSRRDAPEAGTTDLH